LTLHDAIKTHEIFTTVLMAATFLLVRLQCLGW